ncbi:MAG TPA: prepilin-type N-terminal cleavage/methylation domain-containing protein [Anaerohalosphaeraceae bacterium]|nr:prepilin-type N-terminal cleavage/methylation domain-containing protein [Anaerohalosphaeraceae bacterium]HOL87830.1 prepilin-type N-terminal cleavage/methylation domain-containing protein [Anaerohalosphaeraceae bacterium]HPP55182.1 prepilin-type N-terminal cleavage/methylation domain-containing protein [Anaerohalosphaeraceae bacterium]
MKTLRSVPNGFTMIEVLISMTILAVLMAAVAVAFDASMKNYKDNEGLAKQMNIARAALLRITNDIRTARGIVADADNTQCSIDKNGDGEADITYRFDGNQKVLYLDVYSAGSTSSYVLCKNIAGMTFTRAMVPGQPTLVRNVRITMTITDDAGQMAKKLVAAAVVRRNL